MALPDERLREIVINLARRPGHESVRADVRELLISHLGVAESEITLEQNLAEVRGRIDALVAQTVFEFKSNLAKEREDAEQQLEKYLTDREQASGRRFIGIATDGAEFALYELRRGKLAKLQNRFDLAGELRRNKRGATEAAHGLAAWISPLIDQRPELPPEPAVIRRELGRESIVYEIARGRLEAMWEAVKVDAEVSNKRKLWADRLSLVYGTSVEDDALFVQHTYLTLVAKTMATLMLGEEPPRAADLLAGKPFSEAGIEGVVESDFFDWVIVAPEGDNVVNQISAQVARFRLGDITHDVLKVLYESLIDPEQRHDLGEYYTPDWLAQWICEGVIDRPLDQRVLDPSCGSGTFLFHAVRRFFAAAEIAGIENREAIQRCSELIFGIDVHPVAVINARVTYLLAIGEARLREHPHFSIPVYLGDSMQWSAEQLILSGNIVVQVPSEGDEGQRGKRPPPDLSFPRAVAESPQLFDAVIGEMLRMSEHGAGAEEWEASAERRFRREIATRTEDPERAMKILATTYENLGRLRRERRNHIWGYVARNLIRPVWLASADQKVDVIVGNPPWLAQRHMSRELQQLFQKECKARGLWVGGKVATHQDLSAYFFARCVELYLRDGGAIACVMPYAVMSRMAYEGFRTGNFKEYGAARFIEAWAFDENVKNLFNVPCCVLIARKERPGRLPEKITTYVGELPRRDAGAKEAAEHLRGRSAPWPKARRDTESEYGSRFRQGATVVPRMLFVVTRASTGRFGSDVNRPVVESRRTNLEKAPWRALKPLRGPIEREFLRPMLLGESIAPYRLLNSVEAVIAWDAKAGKLLDAKGARGAGYGSVAEWLEKAEALWNKHGRRRMALGERLDNFRELSEQFPIPKLRVVYSKAGTLSAAAVLDDRRTVVDHKLYWCAVDEIDEARFMIAVLNSDATRKEVEDRQSRGQWGPRDFDKLLAEAIPAFEENKLEHRELVRLAERAERIARAVAIPDKMGFVRARQMIREALREDGVAGKIDKIVNDLLAPS